MNKDINIVLKKHALDYEIESLTNTLAIKTDGDEKRYVGDCISNQEADYLCKVDFYNVTINCDL